MPTCGECSYLVRDCAGGYVCAGKVNQCFAGPVTPQTDASTCIRFDRKEKDPPPGATR